MKITRLVGHSVFLASVALFLTGMTPASGQDPLQPVNPHPGHLQPVPDAPSPVEGRPQESYAADDAGCSCQTECVCGSRVVGGRPRALIGRSAGGVCESGLGAAGIGGALHGGVPVLAPHARADLRAQQQTATRSWHAGYAHTGWGAPVALVVPPTARMQTRMGWGVSQTMMSPIYPQFKRPYPGPVVSDGMSQPAPLLPTPRWPSHTDQFGVYPVRGPW